MSRLADQEIASRACASARAVYWTEGGGVDVLRQNVYANCCPEHAFACTPRTLGHFLQLLL